ncbi:MAG: hypothetical protein ACLFOC_03000 [Campylobacterales bacterium]
MSNKLSIYIFLGITIFFLLVASFFVAVFSEFGNNIIKAQIQEVIDEKSPQKLIVKEFKLSPSQIHIYIESEKNSFISVDANYSLLSFQADGIYKANIRELGDYKELTDIKLQGELVSAGEFRAEAEHIDIQGIVNVAEADIDFDIDLKDNLFQKAIISSDTIKIENLLHLLSQPKVASGAIKLDSDITPSEDGHIKGSATISIDKGIAYRDALKNSYNIEIPKDAEFKAQAKANIDRKNLSINTQVVSPLLELTTQNLLLNLDKMSANGDIKALINPIKTELFNIKKQTKLLANLKAKDSITDIKLLSDMFDSSIKASIVLDKFEPKKVVANSELIKVENILAFLNQPDLSSGELKADVDMDILSDTNIKGKALLEITNAIVYKNILKDNLDIEIKNDIPYTSNSEIEFGGEIIKAKSNIKSSLLDLELQDVVYYLKNSSFDGEFNAELEPIDTPYFYIDEPLTIKGSAKADEKTTTIQANTKLFSSDIALSALLETFKTKAISIKAPSISLKDLLRFSKQDPLASANVALNVDIKNIESKPKGLIDIKSDNLLITKKSLKESLEVENADKDITGSFSLNSVIKSGIANSALELSTNVADIRTQKLHYDIENSSLQSDFLVSISNLNALEFLTGTALYGSIDIANSLNYKDELINYHANSKTLGGEVDVVFDDYKIDATANNIDAHLLDEMLGLTKVFKSGNFNMKSKLRLEKNSEDMLKSLNGDFRLEGNQLVLEGYNIDLIVDNFKSTQSVTLLDVGAIVLAGPVGIAATKGLSAGGMAYGGSGGDTTINELLVKSTIKNGIAHADDVAFSTNKNLIAASGAIQLWNKEFKNFWIAVVDKHGCSEYKQRVGGTINNPNIITTQSSFEIVKNVAKSVGSIFSDTADSVIGAIGGNKVEKKCDKFYSGEVEFKK